MLPGGKDTRKLGENLVAGFSADRVVMVLCSTKESGCLQLNDRVVIGRALRVLRRALKRGEHWSDVRQSLPSWIEDPRQVPEYINRLIGILNSLLRREIVEKDDIQLLVDFFIDYSKILLDRSKSS